MRRKRKYIEKKYIVLIVILFICIFIGLSINIVKTERKLSFFEKIIKDSVLFVNRVIYFPIDFVSDRVFEIKEKNNIYEKYLELKNKEAEINKINILNKELQKEVDEMKSLLELNNTLSVNSFINASVINRNLDYFSNTITIDKGEIAGVKVGDAVAIKNGLIGKIINTTNYHSTVKLLTSNDVNNKISVKIDNNGKYIYGLLTGYKDGFLLVEGIDTNDVVNKDSLVTTTGLSGLFPSGILVGSVDSVTKDNFDLTTTLLVKSQVDFNDINFVSVLKRISE